MAQEDEDSADRETVVRVKAQVMTRGEYGWNPLEGGGMSYVCIYKRRAIKDDVNQEYFIQGTRISDEMVLLQCMLKANVEYERADPTFHHWKLDGRKFGLTFLTNNDARTFSQGIKDAVHDLSKGIPPENFSLDIGEDEAYRVHMVGRNSSLPTSSQSTSPLSTSSPSGASHPFSVISDSQRCSPTTNLLQSRRSDFSNFHKIVYEPSNYLPAKNRSKPRNSTSAKLKNERRPIVVYSSQKPNTDLSPVIKDSWDSIGPYVHFEKRGNPKTPQRNSVTGSGHLYSYPSVEALSSSRNPRKETPVVYNFKSRQVRSTSEPQIASVRCTTPPLPRRSSSRQRCCLVGNNQPERHNECVSQRRKQCIVCREMYSPKNNPRGSCKEGEDKVKKGIECVSCLYCARGVLYHCTADAEGDYMEPCVCTSNSRRNCRRWTLLAVLSLFLPCLWCYWPLTLCHRGCVSSGCCGPRHHAADDD